MLEQITTSELLLALSIIVGILAGIVTLWEKILNGAKWIIKYLKNGLARFKKMPSNPFDDQGRITDSSRFFGRHELLRTVFEELKKGTNLSLIGKTQMGNSSLLYQVYQTGAKELPGTHFIYLDMQIVHDEGDFFKALCSEIGISECRGFELHRALRGKRYVLCLDNIERMTNQLFSGDERTELRGLAESADAPLTLLIASHSPLAELFPDSPLEVSPLAGICHTIEMLPFSKQEVYAFIETRLHSTGRQFTETEIETIWQESQGHPAKIQQVAKALFEQSITTRIVF